MDKNATPGKFWDIRRVIVISWPFILALLIFLCVRIAIFNPGFVDHYYSKGLYPIIAASFSFVSNFIPFSLWDTFWVLSILILIISLVLAAFKRLKLKWMFLRIFQSLALLYSFFYISWGFNYFRPGIETRIDWEKPKAEEKKFRSILDSIIVLANSSYTLVRLQDYSQIDKLVEDSFQRKSEDLGIGYPNGSRRPKTMIFSYFITKLGVSGYFGPFFNEVHLNSYLLPMEYPFILAHEKAHQFGIANEAEANLAGYIICSTSEDLRLQYSGYTYMLLYFLQDAKQLHDYQAYMKKIDKKVMQDLIFRRQYYEGLQNKKLKKVQAAANDAYLKTNHIKTGIKNYNQVVSLVITWYYNLDLKKVQKGE
jgi:hypothetical protein